MKTSIIRLSSFFALAWLLCVPLLGIWAACPANNPVSVNALNIQGPDSTGNQGYPIAVVGATGCPLDVTVVGGGGNCVTQCTSPWIVGFGGVSQPVTVSNPTSSCVTQCSSPWIVGGADSVGAASTAKPVLAAGTDHAGLVRTDFHPSNASVAFAAGNPQGVVLYGREGGSTGWLPFSVGLPNSDNSPESYVTAARSLECEFDPTQGNLTYVRRRTTNIFVPINAVGIAAETTIYTPPGGKKFRLMGYHLAASVAGNVVIRDNTAGATIVIVPSAAGGSGIFVDLKNGILSAAAGNVLTAQGPALDTLSGELELTAE